MSVPFLLLALHFVADFILQTDWMAINKSKSMQALLAHTSLYSLVFLPFYGVSFALITFMLHTVQDYLTSRLTSRLWQANERHWFFVAVGADQLLHYLGFALTLLLLA